MLRLERCDGGGFWRCEGGFGRNGWGQNWDLHVARGGRVRQLDPFGELLAPEWPDIRWAHIANLRALVAPLAAIYIKLTSNLESAVSVTWAGRRCWRSSGAAGWLWAGLGHVQRAAACPVWLPESAERSRAGGGYAISPVYCLLALSKYP